MRLNLTGCRFEALWRHCSGSFLVFWQITLMVMRQKILGHVLEETRLVRRPIQGIKVWSNMHKAANQISNDGKRREYWKDLEN